ncbi:MAG: alkaline phosphatase family protein [Caldilineaceae bacterium]|nr:alkaline phosphatase family protein [Caldilineaceae bacterium]
MRRVIFLFLDGVGLGQGDPAVNPLAADVFPTLDMLLDGAPPIAATGALSTAKAELIPTDAGLGIPGRPQSATGQSALLTGINASQRLGEHYGPRPDDRVRAVLDEGSFFRVLRDAGHAGYFCNAYPQGYFDAVNRGKRRLSAVPYAATVGGQTLLNHGDLLAGRALAADFTNQGWHDLLGYTDVPVFSPQEGGRQLWRLAQGYSFILFEHWMTDLLGHRQQRDEAVRVFQTFDGFLAGLLEAADLEETMIVVTSDHGNVEDCSHGKHTENPVLTLLLGAQRKTYAPRVQTLTDFVPIMADFLALPSL